MTEIYKLTIKTTQTKQKTQLENFAKNTDFDGFANE